MRLGALIASHVRMRLTWILDSPSVHVQLQLGEEAGCAAGLPKAAATTRLGRAHIRYQSWPSLEFMVCRQPRTAAIRMDFCGLAG